MKLVVTYKCVEYNIFNIFTILQYKYASNFERMIKKCFNSEFVKNNNFLSEYGVSHTVLKRVGV